MSTSGKHASEQSKEGEVNRPFSTSIVFDRAFSVVEAAEILGVSVDTVHRLLRTRKLSFQRTSARRTVIRESALREYLDEVTVERLA